MVMLGSMRDDVHGHHVVASEPGGKLTQAAYIVVSDIEALYEHVQAKGANIVMELEAQPYGGSLFAVRDPEGETLEHRLVRFVLSSGHSNHSERSKVFP